MPIWMAYTMAASLGQIILDSDYNLQNTH